MSGTDRSWDSGYYGQLQTPNGYTVPPGRNPAAAWVDGCDTFWTFGGWALGESV